MLTPEPMPTVARIVHYVSYGTPGGEYTSVCRAAVVTAVAPAGDIWRVGLAVLNPTGAFFNTDIPHHPGDPDIEQGACCNGHTDRRYPGGTWHWPQIT